jgi:DNA-directed RNA polymerase subunit RPC12/RpoP
MGEQRANIPPRYAVRLSDLRPYHILTAVCPFCGHKARKRIWQITVGLSPHTRLIDIDDRLRCMRCGSRGHATLLVTVTEDE